MSEVICLATGESNELVVKTGVTAHPACKPYPRTIPEYLIPIKKGGIVENVYYIGEILECMPDEVYMYKDRLSKIDFNNLIEYHELRKDSFGYAKKTEKYRFYICKKTYDIEPSFRIRNIQISKRMELEQIPILR